MKRSKMLSIIADHFYHCNIDSEECVIKAEKLLSEIEVLGILPPLCIKKVAQYEIKCNEWELE